MSGINKLMGFFELKELGIPTIPFKEFDLKTDLSPDFLWTIRVAIYKGDDLNLPRAVGVTADEGMRKGREYYQKYKDKGIVIYYPYFIAEKSGTLEISNSRIIIEAVDGDLWNLVTEGKRNITVIIDQKGKVVYGEQYFLKDDELVKILEHVAIIQTRYREMLAAGKSILLEWSFAYKTDVNRYPIDEKYLVFYEIRSI